MIATYLLPGAFLVLFMGALVAQFLVGRRDRDRLVARRLADTLESRGKKRGTASDQTQSLAIPELSQTPMARLSALFGFDQARPDLYPIPPVLIVILALVVAIGLAWLVSLIVGELAMLASPIFWVIASRLAFRRYQQKRIDILFKQFPDALSMIVRAVRVGIPVAEAIRAVARENEEPTAGEFGRAAGQIAIGVPFDEALRRMAARSGLAEYRFFATALSLQSQTGGNLSETLENLADVIRKRVAARERGFALAAEARMSANVLSALPILLFIALWFMDPGLIAQMLATRTGHILLGATVGLLLFGMYSMRLMIEASLS